MAVEEQGSASMRGVPLGFWQQLLSSLPHSDKLNLFRTSRWLASLVLGNTSHIRVHLQGVSKSVQGRRDAINSLLQGCEQLSIEADADGACVLAEPGNIAPCVTSLSIAWPKDTTPAGRRSTGYQFTCSSYAFVPALASYDWGAFENVLELRLSGVRVLPTYDVHQVHAVSCLCEALGNGALSSLRALHFNAHYTEADVIDMQTVHHLARALGHRLTHLHTNVPAFLFNVQELTNLQAVHFHDVYLTANTIVPLLSHPRLHTVTIGDGCGIDKSYSHCGCTWHTLIIAHGYLRILESLPWKGIRQVKVVRKLMKDEHDVYTLQLELFKHGVVVTVEPLDGVFEIHGLGHWALSFVERLRRPCELHIHDSIGEDSFQYFFWSHLPESVHTVHFVEVSYYRRWQMLWSYIPKAVSSISLCNCSIGYDDMHHLVRNAPAHLKSLHIACTDATRLVVHGLAPKHLKVYFE